MTKRVVSKPFLADKDSLPENSKYDGQSSREGMHAYTRWKGIFEHYRMQKESIQLDVSTKSYASPKLIDLFELVQF